jgi:hypothetical protein
MTELAEAVLLMAIAGGVKRWKDATTGIAMMRSRRITRI